MKKKIGIASVLVLALFVTGCSSIFNKNNDNNAKMIDDDTKVQDEVVYEDVVRNFFLISEESEVEYSINEILRGVPTNVVGKSHSLSGNVVMNTEGDFEVISGEIKLDAKSFKTDISARDNNVANLILKANEEGNEFNVFKRDTISGLEADLVRNQDLPVEITGNITIAKVTQTMTFIGTMNWSDENTFSGVISADLTYGNFDLFLPDFDFFTGVDEIAKLKISFKATAN